MTLAEAIRRGAKLAPQGVFQWVDGYSGVTCALGAAFQGVFGPRAALGPRSELLLYERFPELFDVWCRPPVPGARARNRLPLLEVIATLNDWERWSREKIADFVESVVTAASEKKAA